jgi:hypothetical protein
MNFGWNGGFGIDIAVACAIMNIPPQGAVMRTMLLSPEGVSRSKPWAYFIESMPVDNELGSLRRPNGS